ncbi:Hypp1379 [Branchiostoma lanceolatum]|uniref:Hypp1379 protein n=1 Tax=Branchiostoma lanceolatum TaxID=7740 RepID=A0A8K0ENF4_BRALA|nr:Hypp1379 [Branchiostoma lanceolatum]
MAANVAVILIFLSLICYPKTTQATYMAMQATNQTFVESSYGPGNIPINWTASWERLEDAVSLLCFHHAYALHNYTASSKTYAGHTMNNTGRVDFPARSGKESVDKNKPVECKLAADSAQDLPPSFQAMYCTVSWTEKPQLSTSSDAGLQGLCAPMSCIEREVALLVETGLLGIKPKTPRDVDYIDCERNEDDARSGALGIISTIAGVSVLVLVLVGTMYEFIITVYYTEERKRSLTAASKCGRFLMCFSAYSNTKKVFDTRQSPGQLPALHGLRVLSCLWIIYGHVDFYAMFFNLSNRSEYDGRRREWWYFVLDCNNMAVDTFLVLSAFLVTHWLLNQLKKNNGEFTWKDLGRHYLHRYWRLTPVYLYLVLLMLPSEKGCQTYWWANLLYLNNYFTGDERRCVGVAWYLAVDMQMFIIAPGLILVMYKKPKLGVTINVLLVVLSWVFYGGLRQLDPIAEPKGVGNSYFWTPGRMGPYIMGILLAYLLFRTNSKVPNTRATKVRMLVGWAVGITLGLVATVMPTMLRAMTPWPGFEIRANIGWSAVERSIFAASVCWIIYACCAGYGGIVSEFLSWKAWLPLSRLSYVTYLIHSMHISVFYGIFESLIYNGLAWVVIFAGLSVWSFCSACMYSLAVEVPFSELGKMIIPQRRGRQPENGKAPAPTGAEEPETLPLQATPREELSQKPEDHETDKTHVENNV